MRRQSMTLLFATVVALLALSAGGGTTGGTRHEGHAHAQDALPEGVLDFATGLAGVGGTVSWAGGDAPLVGADIRVGVVTAIGTPLTPPPAVVGPSTPGWGVLSFSTGPHVGFNPATGLHQFSGPGTFSITGTVPDAGITTPVTLLSGDLTDATFGPHGAINLGLVAGAGVADGGLLSFVGLPPTSTFSVSGFLMTSGPGVSSEAFTTTVTSIEMAAPVVRKCRYMVLATPTRCQLGNPPPVGTIICANCPDRATDCPDLPGGGVCTVKRSGLRGFVNFLCPGVTLSVTPQVRACEDGCQPGDFTASIVVSTCR